MKHSWIIAAAIAGVAWMAAGPSSAQVKMIDRAAAVVNGKMIPLSEVERRAAPDIRRLEQEGRLTREVRIGVLKRALDEMITDQVLEAEQAVLGMEVTEQEVELAIEDVRRQNRMDPVTFERALAAQNLTMSEYRDRLRRELISMKLLGQKVRSKVKVTDEDVRAEYLRQSKLAQSDFEVHARQIVVRVPEGASPEVEEKARERASEYAKRARGGEDFAALARKVSDSPSRADGGDVGFFKRGEMLPAFDKAAFALEPGEVSEPVRTSFGWHIIQVVERRAGEAQEFDEVKDTIREKLIRDRMEAQAATYLKSLRDKAAVEVLVPELRG